MLNLFKNQRKLSLWFKKRKAKLGIRLWSCWVFLSEHPSYYLKPFQTMTNSSTPKLVSLQVRVAVSHNFSNVHMVHEGDCDQFWTGRREPWRPWCDLCLSQGCLQENDLELFWNVFPGEGFPKGFFQTKPLALLGTLPACSWALGNAEDPCRGDGTERGAQLQAPNLLLLRPPCWAWPVLPRMKEL